MSAVPVQGFPAVVEVQVGQGLPGFTIVGLSDAACRSTRDRVRAAVLCSGLKWPHHRITVNLAPSRGGTLASMDLAIAVGVLASDGQIVADMSGMAFIGELGLDGSIRPVPVVLPKASLDGADEVVVPAANAGEARALSRGVVRPVESLGEVVRCLRGEPWGRSAQVVAP